MSELISIVVPVYNESEAVSIFFSEVQSVLANVDFQFEYIFVNDGSSDETLERLLELMKINEGVKVVDLSRNFGKEAALTAGLSVANGDAVVPMDVDLQDPPNLIPEMVKHWRKGAEVVLARRANRSVDTWAKRASASWFYKIHNKIASPKIPENVGDFRLMDIMVVNALKELPESRRFMKGIFAWLGFRSVYIDYVRAERVAGESKFNGWRLWNFALEGITSFSISPLRVWTYVGVFVSICSFAFATFVLFRSLISGVDVAGYASLIVAVTFLGGLQLIGIGIIGEYLGRAYIESKRRPPFLIRKVYSGVQHGS